MKLTQQVGDNIFAIDLIERQHKGLSSAYVVRGKKLALIECGATSSAAALLAGLRELGIDPNELAYLLVTHIHLDHAGGAGYWARKLPHLKVMVHERGAKHLMDPSRLAIAAENFWGDEYSKFGEIIPIPNHRIQVLQDGDEIDLGGRCLKVIETVGHSTHHHAFYDPDTRGLFSGDALGLYLPRLSSFLGDDIIIPGVLHPLDLEVMLASLQKMALLNVDTIFFTHFGSKTQARTIIESEIGQLVIWSEVIKKVARAGKPIETALDYISNYVFRTQVNQGLNLDDHPDLRFDKELVDHTVASVVEGLWHYHNRLLEGL